jgi:hypothetical protein
VGRAVVGRAFFVGREQQRHAAGVPRLGGDEGLGRARAARSQVSVTL